MPHSFKAEIESEWPFMLRMSKVIVDPLRVRILGECQIGSISPRCYYEEFGGVSLDRVSRAFDVLVEYDWIGEAKARDEAAPADPADRLYRAIDMAVIDEEDLASMPDPVRALVGPMVFEGLAGRVKEAIDSGTMEGRTDRHMSWTPLVLDRLGWERVISRVDALFYSLSQEQRDAEARIADSGEERIPITVGLLTFESPEKS